MPRKNTKKFLNYLTKMEENNLMIVVLDRMANYVKISMIIAVLLIIWNMYITYRLFGDKADTKSAKHKNKSAKSKRKSKN